MILCPFCGSEMPDEARACPSCRSVLVERKEPGKKRELPPALHPMVTFTVILVASAALLAASLIRTSPAAKNPKPKPVAQAPAPEPSAETPAPTEPPRNLTPVAPANANQDPREAYEKFTAYETKIKETLAEVDKLETEMEDLRRDNTPENRQALGEKLNAMRAVRQQLRTVEPPISLRRANTHISNSVDITMRGFRSFIIYMESGDLSKLDQARKDLNKAQKYRSQGLQEINEQKSKLPPPPPEPTPEPEAKPPVTPPATPPAVKPGDTQTDNPNRMFPPGYQPQPGDQPGDEQPPADDAGGTYPQDGDSAYYDDQPYPEDGQSPLDQDPDGQYPDDQDQPPADDNGGYIENPY